MTVLTPSYYSEQVTTLRNKRGDRLIKPADGGGRIRNFYAYYKNTTGATIAANSIISLMFVPGGRIIPHLSYILTSDFGSTTTLEVGWNQYKENDTDTVTDDTNGLIDALDVSGQAVSQFLSASASGSVAAVRSPGVTIGGYAEILAKVLGSTMAADATIELYLAMIIS